MLYCQMRPTCSGVTPQSEINHSSSPTTFALSGTQDVVGDIILRLILKNGWKSVTILLDQSQESSTMYYARFAAILVQLSHNYPDITISIINFKSKNISTMAAALMELQVHSRGKEKHWRMPPQLSRVDLKLSSGDFDDADCGCFQCASKAISEHCKNT